MVLYIDDEPDTLMYFNPIYNDDPDVVQNEFLLFDFELFFTRAPETNSDGEEEDYSNLETKTVYTSYPFQKDRLIREDKDYIQAVVYHILDWIEVPSYRDIVRYLTDEIWDLKERDAISKVERMKITLDVIAYRFPGEIVELDQDVDVKFAVAPASDEAVETHLETVVVKTEGYCLICMDEIRVGSDVPVGRLPCKHEFHRTCGEKWLKNSGVCPVCRSVFPSS